MAIPFQPFGLRQNRELIGAGGNFQISYRAIKKGYSSPIGWGDPVITLTSPNAGYIGPYAETGTRILGVLVGLLPYYDVTLQQIVNKNWWAGSENPAGDVSAMVVDDYTQSFLIQPNGGPVTQAMIGLNADIGGAGAPAASGGSVGASTAYLDFSTIGTANTLPLRILNIVTLAYGGTDPTVPASQQQAYNWVEVKLNTPEALQQTGV